MNPETMRFEDLPEGSDVERLARDEGWPSFKIGELVELKGIVFRVTRARGRKLVMESVRMADASAVPSMARALLQDLAEAGCMCDMADTIDKHWPGPRLKGKCFGCRAKELVARLEHGK